MKRSMLMFISAFFLCVAYAQRPAGKQAIGSNLRPVVQAKVQTILLEMALKDKKKEKDLETLLTKQLMSIHKIQAAYEKTVKFATDSMNEDKRAHVMLNVSNRRLANLYKEHFVFEARLSVYLTAEEVEQVKEIMTFRELPKRFDALLTKYPMLTKEQKLLAREMLKAAREQAFDCVHQADMQLCFDEAVEQIESQFETSSN